MPQKFFPQLTLIRKCANFQQKIASVTSCRTSQTSRPQFCFTKYPIQSLGHSACTIYFLLKISTLRAKGIRKIFPNQKQEGLPLLLDWIWCSFAQIVYQVGDLGNAAPNPIVYQQQSNWRLRSEIRFSSIFNSVNVDRSHL